MPKRLRGFLADRRRPLLLSGKRVGPPPPAGHSCTSRLVDWSQHRGYMRYDKRAHEEERHGNQHQNSIVFERATRARLNSDVSLPNPMPQWSVGDFAASIPPHARLRYWTMARTMGYPQISLGVFRPDASPAVLRTRAAADAPSQLGISVTSHQRATSHPQNLSPNVVPSNRGQASGAGLPLYTPLVPPNPAVEETIQEDTDNQLVPFRVQTT